jgi:predicted HTH domain antitoxin
MIDVRRNLLWIGEMNMADNTMTIAYPDELLLSLKKSPDEFEAEARLLLAVKLYELHRVSTGMAAQLAGVSRPVFLFELARFGLSPLGQEPDELADDYRNA